MTMKPTHQEYKKQYIKTVRETFAHPELEKAKRKYIQGKISKEKAIQKFKQIRNQ